MSLNNVNVASAHAFCLLQYLNRQGVPSTEGLSILGLSGYASDMSDFPDVIALNDYVAACSSLNAWSSDPLACLKIGLQQSISDFSLLAQLVSYAATIRDALDLYVRYLDAFNPGFPTSIQRRSNSIDTPVDNKHYSMKESSALMELRMANCIRLLRSISADAIPDLVLCVNFQHPAAVDQEIYSSLLGTQVNFNQSHTSFELSADAMDTPLITRNEDALINAIQRAEKHRLLLGIKSSDVLTRARAVIRTGLENSDVTLPTVAKQLLISASTLKRRLSEVDICFQDVLDDERKKEALYLLNHTGLSINAISKKTGFASMSSFTQSFKRLTGSAPSEVRRVAVK